MGPSAPSATESNASDQGRRHDRQERVSAWFDLGLSILALVMLGLMVVEFTVPLSPAASELIGRAELGIWAVFLLAFLVEFGMAPSKTAYLRSHWLTALSVALPALRIFRVARALRILRSARVLRGLSVARLVTSLNRTTGALGTFVRRGHIGYLVALTTLVVVTAAAGAYYLERGAPGASIRSLSDALWWSSTIVTTVNSELETVTAEARILALLLRIYGVAVIGYLTGSIAAYLLGRPGAPFASPSRDDLEDVRLRLSRLEDGLKRVEGGDGFGNGEGAPQQPRLE